MLGTTLSPLPTTPVVGKRAFVLDHKGRDIFDLIVRRTHRTCLLEYSGLLKGLGGVPLKVCGKTHVATSGIFSPFEVVV